MDIEVLISCVFNKKTLWDQKDPQHHNRFVLDKLWDAVAHEMNSTRKVVRTKWKTLRDSYRKELNKIPVKSSGDDCSQSTYKSSWPYFESISFLKDQITVRSSGLNLSDVGHDDMAHEADVSSEAYERNVQVLDDWNCVNQPSSAEESLEETTSTHAGKGLKRKRKTETDISTALIRIEERKLRASGKQNEKTIDEDVCFLESLLPHIRTLNPQSKMLLRIKMQELVYNFVYVNQTNGLTNQ